MSPIYLDYNATTPVDPVVLQKMLPYFTEQFGNASSNSHRWGWAAQTAVKEARHHLAQLIQAHDHEIIFNSGATEGNNSVVFGLIRQLRAQNPQEKIHIISSRLEHDSMLSCLDYAQKYENIEVDYVPCDKHGFIAPEDIAAAIKPHTRLISILWAQNILGTIQNMQAIAQIAKKNKIYFHTDATQAIGKVKIDLNATPVDILTASAHKFYGPKGVGFIFTRSHNPKVTLHPLLFGGGQENDKRSGTLNVPAIVGMGEAARLILSHFDEYVQHQQSIKDYLWEQLQQKCPGVRLLSPTHNVVANTLQIYFPQQNHEKLIALFSQIGISAGAACHSGIWSQNATLKAIGVSEADSKFCFRLSVGRFNTHEEIDQAVGEISKIK